MALRAERLPEQRWLHPGAWWAWALALAAAASRMTNPILLVLLIAVSGYVVAARRPATYWGASFAGFLRIGVLIVIIRVAFAVLIGLPVGTHVLVTLPSLALPGWAQGIRLGGPVTVEQVLAAASDGLRLAAMFACLGAANSLASPSRLLKALPTAVYEAGVAVVVAMTFAPQLVADAMRVRTALRLRGRRATGIAGLATAAMPVLAGALDRSVTLAAAMDSRGFGRSAEVPRRARRMTAVMLMAGLTGIALGVAAALDAGTSSHLTLPLLGVGAALAGLGIGLAGRRGIRTRYRPDPWRLPEWATVGAGLATAVTIAGCPHAVLSLTVVPLTWPMLSVPSVAGLLVALLPAVVTPLPPGEPSAPRVRALAAVAS